MTSERRTEDGDRLHEARGVKGSTGKKGEREIWKRDEQYREGLEYEDFDNSPGW